MINITIQGKPIAKERPRFTKEGRTYDRQGQEKKLTRYLIMKEMADRGVLRRLQDEISVEMTFYTPIPNSWSQKRKNAVLGKPDGRRPDIDNYAKFYCDVMNELVYQDDNMITQLWCEKRYSDKPKVDIFINEIKNGEMIKEHVTTFKDQITIEDLEFVVKKANKIGLKRRGVYRVFMEEDGDGKHIYFECQGIKVNQDNKGCL
jgi:Holliday junction resolvase RusA-like endonuclease